MTIDFQIPIEYFKPQVCSCGASNFLYTDMNDGSKLCWCQGCSNLVLVVPLEGVVLIEEEMSGNVPCVAVYSWKKGVGWGADDDCITILEEL